MSKTQSLLKCINCTSYSFITTPLRGYCKSHCKGGIQCDDPACSDFSLKEGVTIENSLCNHCLVPSYRDTACVKYDAGFSEKPAEVYDEDNKINKSKEDKIMEKITSLEQMRRVKSNCYLLNFYECYIPIEKDVPVELIKEDDCWMVVLPDVFEQPEGFELLHHYADNLHFWGKDFDTLEEALQVYNELCLKF